MNSVLEQLGLIGIIPVVVIEDETNAPPLARALMESGLSTMEITFRTPSAKNSLSLIARESPGMLLGAGTVLTVDQAKTAVQSGAKYIVSPGLNRKVVEYCLANDIPVIPGIASPTDIENAVELGLRVVKFFPAEASGGLEYLKAISAPFGDMMFVPTGGIDENNLLPYLKFRHVLACGGSWMVKADLISGKQFEEIRKLATRAVGKMLGFQLCHVGMNFADAGEAVREASVLSGLLQLPAQVGEGSVFVGRQFEFLKRSGLGLHGHVAIGTNFIERAMEHFVRRGISIKDGTMSRREGALASVFLDLEIGGFAVHLLQL